MTRPDLVLIMTDQQRHDQVGYAGGSGFDTPHLDSLARRGTIFTSAYSASTTCVPARVALLTGLQPHRVPSQVNRLALREGFWTIAHALRAAGYETAAIGKMHFFPPHADHGFETMRLCEHPRVFKPEDAAEFDDYQRDLYDAGMSDWRFRGDGSARWPRGPFPYPAEWHPTAWVEREVVQFLEGRDRRRPLFLVVSFPHPHEPHNPPASYASMYSPDDSPRPCSGFDVNEKLPPVFRYAMTEVATRQANRVDGERNDAMAYLALVRALVRQIDDAVGTITARIDFDKTLMCFTSDHGDYGGNRGLVGKSPWIPFDDLARVPLFAVGHGIRPGASSDELVQSYDTALTFLDAAGLPADETVFGTRSLRAVGSDSRTASDDRPVFCGTNLEWPSVRRGRHKVILNKQWDIGVLFDLVDDPLESIDLGADPHHAGIAAELRALLMTELTRPIPALPSFDAQVPPPSFAGRVRGLLRRR